MSVEDVGEILLNPLLFLMLQFFFFPVVVLKPAFFVDLSAKRQILFVATCREAADIALSTKRRWMDSGANCCCA